MSHFTDGQAERMMTSWVEYRLLPKMLSEHGINPPESKKGGTSAWIIG